jgi:hypothetical protein
MPATNCPKHFGQIKPTGLRLQERGQRDKMREYQCDNGEYWQVWRYEGYLKTPQGGHLWSRVELWVEWPARWNEKRKEQREPVDQLENMGFERVESEGRK